MCIYSPRKKNRKTISKFRLRIWNNSKTDSQNLFSRWHYNFYSIGNTKPMLIGFASHFKAMGLSYRILKRRERLCLTICGWAY